MTESVKNGIALPFLTFFFFFSFVYRKLPTFAVGTLARATHRTTI